MGAIFKLTAATYLVLIGMGVNASHISYGTPAHQNQTSWQKSLVDELSLLPFVVAQSTDPGKPEGEKGGPSGGGAAGGRCVQDLIDVSI